MEIKTKLDIGKFNNALNYVINNNDMLKARITKNGKQEILEKKLSYTIDVKDLREFEADYQKDVIKEYRKELSHYVHDVYKWPLFEFKVIKINDEESYLFVSIDLIIADGMSIMSLFKQIMDCYYERESDNTKYTFKEYLYNLEKLRTTEKYRKAQLYWMCKLDDYKNYPQIPLKESLINVKKPKFERKIKIFDKNMYSKLKESVSKTSNTVSSMLCTIFSKVLADWSRSNKFTLNVTVFNRMPFNNDIDKVIGDFTTTILLDIDYEKDSSLKTNCKKIQSNMIKGMENSIYDGIKVAREINKRKTKDNQLIFPIVFTSMLFGSKKDYLSELGEVKYSLSQTPQVILDFQVMDRGEELQISWDYIDELFEKRVIDSMFNQYIDELVSFIEGNECKIDYFKEDRKILNEYNNTSKEFESTNIINEFIKNVKKHPEKIAISHKKRIITYKELDILSNKVASYLLEEGIHKDDYVVVYVNRSIETIINILGVLKAGAAYIPVAEEYPENRKSYIAEQSNAEFMLTTDIVSVLEDQEEYIINESQLGEKAYCIYTSGSTGRPKGVEISHEAVINTILDVNNRFNITDKDIILGVSSQTFDLSVYDIFGSLASGAELVLIDSLLDVDDLIATIKEKKITVINCVPAIMQMIVERLKDKPKYEYWNLSGKKEKVDVFDNLSLRVVMLSGDYINVALPEKIVEMFPCAELYSLGGATEAAIWSIYYPIKKVNKNWTTIPYGYPLSNQKIYILNDELQQQFVGVEGEIYIGGTGVALGYLNDEEKTKKAFIDTERFGKIYKTGDYGVFTEHNYVEFRGRKDSQIKIRGHRIELGEIENVANEISKINNAVAAIKNINGHDVIVLYYISKEELDSNSIKEYIKEYLPEYMIPACVVKINNIPLSSNGKVSKKMLPLPNEIQSFEEVTKPRNDNEKIILAIWKEVLKVDEINITDTFYDIGGDSVSMVKILNILKDRFGITLDVMSFITNNTIEAMAKLLD